MKSNDFVYVFLFKGTFSEENHNTSTYEEIVNILKELESENDDIGS